MEWNILYGIILIMHLFTLKQKLAMSWDRIKQHRRTVIHIPSLGLSQDIRDSINEFGIRQNTQMARLCDIRGIVYNVHLFCNISKIHVANSGELSVPDWIIIRYLFLFRSQCGRDLCVAGPPEWGDPTVLFQASGSEVCRGVRGGGGPVWHGGEVQDHSPRGHQELPGKYTDCHRFKVFFKNLKCYQYKGNHITLISLK